MADKKPSFNDLLKEVYRSGMPDFEPAPIFGSRVDDSGPPPVTFESAARVRSSRKVPPGNLIVLGTGMIERVQLSEDDYIFAANDRPQSEIVQPKPARPVVAKERGVRKIRFDDE